MKIFLDTSAMMAVLNSEDIFHSAAQKTWSKLLTEEFTICSNNYVLLECYVLLQSKFGLEAVRLFTNDVLPALEVDWIDEQIHNQALSAILAANRKKLSLVDCTSFESMRNLGITQVFSFDKHFQDQGFELVPK